MESVAKIQQFDSLFLSPPVGHEANEVLTPVLNKLACHDLRPNIILSNLPNSSTQY